MPVVVDSSIAACWAMPDEFSATANRTLDILTSDIMLVPTIFWYEIRNVLLVNERRQRISQEHGVLALQKIDEMPRIEDGTHSSDRTMTLARRHALTVYDAAYLELALRHSAALATLDTRLATAARNESIPVIG